jgi:hypothetical protein
MFLLKLFFLVLFFSATAFCDESVVEGDTTEALRASADIYYHQVIEYDSEKAEKEFDEKCQLTRYCTSAATYYSRTPHDVLSQSEIMALLFYTSQGYKEINQHFRGHIGEAGDHIWVTMSKLILDGVKKLPPFQGPVSRIASLSDQDLLPFFPGNVVEFRSFTSAMLESHASLKGIGLSNTIFYITSKNGRQISSYSIFPDEQEILFLPRTLFKVTKRVDPVKEGSHQIWLEEEEVSRLQ